MHQKDDEFMVELMVAREHKGQLLPAQGLHRGLVGLFLPAQGLRRRLVSLLLPPIKLHGGLVGYRSSTQRQVKIS